MAAVDFKPKNRLEVAEEVIASFIEKRSSDRLGLVIFAASSYTKCPLTVDYAILKFYLQETDIGELEDGTALGMALATSVNRIRHAAAKTKIIILLTDGVNNRGEIDPRDAAEMARDFNIKVYTIGVGTRGEAPYPVLDSFGRNATHGQRGDRRGPAAGDRQDHRRSLFPGHRSRLAAQYFQRDRPLGKDQAQNEKLLRDQRAVPLFHRPGTVHSVAGRNRPPQLSAHLALKTKKQSPLTGASTDDP